MLSGSVGELHSPALPDHPQAAQRRASATAGRGLTAFQCWQTGQPTYVRPSQSVSCCTRCRHGAAARLEVRLFVAFGRKWSPRVGVSPVETTVRARRFPTPRRVRPRYFALYVKPTAFVSPSCTVTVAVIAPKASCQASSV